MLPEDPSFPELVTESTRRVWSDCRTVFGMYWDKLNSVLHPCAQTHTLGHKRVNELGSLQSKNANQKERTNIRVEEKKRTGECWSPLL